MTIRPLHDRVVVRRTEAETTSRGGTIVRDHAREKPNHGEGLGEGPGTTLDSGELRPLAVAVGDRVLFGKYTSNEITVDGDELLILRESDILAVVEHTQSVEEAA